MIFFWSLFKVFGDNSKSSYVNHRIYLIQLKKDMQDWIKKRIVEGTYTAAADTSCWIISLRLSQVTENSEEWRRHPYSQSGTKVVPWIVGRAGACLSEKDNFRRGSTSSLMHKGVGGWVWSGVAENEGGWRCLVWVLTSATAMFV